METGENRAEALVETRQRYYMHDHEFYRMVGILGAWGAVNDESRQAELAAMQERYGHTQLDLDIEPFNYLIHSLKSDQPLDAYEYTVFLEACSQDLAAVMQADSGLLRPQRGCEQIETELRGFEEDYLQFFVDPDDPDQQKLADMRQILRTTCLLRSVMKPFVKELTGTNWRAAIEPYINQLSDILFNQLDADAMSPEVKQAVRLFWKYDIGGKLLWDNEYNENDHSAMKAECPPEFAANLDDLVLVSYLCSGSTHTLYRWFTDRTAPEGSSEKHLAVLPIDKEIQPETGDPGTLDRFFKRSTPSGPVKLEVASRRRAAKYLDCTSRVSELLDYYVQYAQADGTWSATLEIVKPGMYMPDIRNTINEQAIATGLPINALVEVNSETGEVMSVSSVPDPSGSRGTPEEHEHEAVAANLNAKNEWRRNPDINLAAQGDAYACIGIIPGYDHNKQPSQNAISNTLAMLKDLRADVKWEIIYRQLYAVWTNDGKLMEPNEEPVLVVTATYFGESADPEELKTVFSEVAASLGQARYFGGQKEQRTRNLGALSFAQGS